MVAVGHKSLQSVTKGYRGLQGVRGEYKVLQGDTRGYRGLQGLDGITKG